MSSYEDRLEIINRESRFRPKYKLLEYDKYRIGKHVLYRIEAIRSFGRVCAGNLGGYIESEDNLSHEDNAWVYFSGFVYGFARISQNASVSNWAQVYDDALVFGNARVGGYCKIYHFAKVFGNALVGDNVEVFGNAVVCGDTVLERTNSKVYGDQVKYEKVHLKTDITERLRAIR